MRKKVWTTAVAGLAGLLLVAGCKKTPAPEPAVPTATVQPAEVEPGVDPVAKAEHKPVTQFTPNRHLYPAPDEAPKDVKAALALAKREHKRVLLDFGGDWCGDCQVLDIYFHQSPNEELLDKNFVEVKVNIGREDANLDLAAKYGVPMPHGVPALAVLDGSGKLLYAQGKEFSDMRYMQPQSVTDFLTKWKP
jgi:thiol-disulfide isomerase/thioredoxin